MDWLTRRRRGIQMDGTQHCPRGDQLTSFLTPSTVASVVVCPSPTSAEASKLSPGVLLLTPGVVACRLQLQWRSRMHIATSSGRLVLCRCEALLIL